MKCSKLFHILQVVIKFMPMSGLQYVWKWKKILQKTIRTQAITECEINILPYPSLFVPFYHSRFAIPMIDHHFWQVLLIHHLTEYMICMQRSSSAVAINFYSLDIVCTPLSVVGVWPPTRASKRGGRGGSLTGSQLWEGVAGKVVVTIFRGATILYKKN